MQPYRRYTFPSLAQCLAGTAGAARVSQERAPPSDSRQSEEALRSARGVGYGAGYESAYESGYKSGYEAGHEAGREAGYEAGHATGLAEGRSAASLEAMDAFVALGEPLDAIVAGFRSLHEATRREMRDELAGLVERVSRQVIRRELAQRPELLLEFVDEALAAMPKAPENVEVRLNPGEYGRVLAAVPERAAAWHLTPDARLEPGECRVKAGGREMDAGCSQRLAVCIERVSAHLQAAVPRQDTTQHMSGNRSSDLSDDLSDVRSDDLSDDLSSDGSKDGSKDGSADA
jgi:flagellar assembly protein FliH